MNINFKSIVIDNFLSIGHSEITLGDQGFVLVKGRNQSTDKSKSNGSGKSTIFDAILWAITGSTLRGASEVVNDRVGKDCSVTLVFDSGDSEYQISRYKSHYKYGNSVHFYEDGELLSDQTKKSQEMIYKKIPSVSPETIGSVILLGQGLPYRFSSLTPSKRKDLLDTMSGSSSQIKILKDQLAQYESEVSRDRAECFRKLSMVEVKISGQERVLEVYKNQQKESSEELRSQIDKMKLSLADYNQEISELIPKVEEVNKNQGVLDSTIKGSSEYLIKCETELNTYKVTASHLSGGTCPTCGRPYEDADIREKEVSKYQNLIRDMSQKVVVLQTKLQNLRKQFESQTDLLRGYENQKTSLLRSIEDTEKSISQINSRLESAEDVESKIEDISKEIVELKITLHDHKEELSGYDKVLENLSYLTRQVSRDFKGFALKDVVEYLSSRSKYYSKYLFDEESLVNISLNGSRIDISMKDRYYENLSGGERQRVDLSVQFALRDMLSVTSGFYCNILVLDEVFDNLDSIGTNNVIKLVTTEFSDVTSVYTVTHHTDIPIPYDKVLLVVKSPEGISEVGEI